MCTDNERVDNILLEHLHVSSQSCVGNFISSVEFVQNHRQYRSACLRRDAGLSRPGLAGQIPRWSPVPILTVFNVDLLC